MTMEESAAEMVRGMQLAIEAVGAHEGVIGVKAKKKHAVEAAQAAGLFGTTTWWPSFSKIRTMLMPTCGYIRSMKQGMNSVMVMATAKRGCAVRRSDPPLPSTRRVRGAARNWRREQPHASPQANPARRRL